MVRVQLFGRSGLKDLVQVDRIAILTGQRSAFEAGPAPVEQQSLAKASLEVIDAKIMPACGEGGRATFGLPCSVDAVVFDDDIPIDGQSGAVVGVDAERVFPFFGHDQFSNENKSKIVRSGC